MEKKKLADEIADFLAKHSKRDVNEPTEWNGPDSSMLELFD